MTNSVRLPRHLFRVALCALAIGVAACSGTGEGAGTGGTGNQGGESATGGTSGAGAVAGTGGEDGNGAGGTGGSGAPGEAGSGGTAGAGGTGGCDAIGNRPRLTEQPTIDRNTVASGETFEVQIPVSSQAVLVRARAIAGSTVVGEAQMSTDGAEVVTLEVPVGEAVGTPRPSEVYVGLTLCAEEDNCLAGDDRTFVSYVQAAPGNPLYFVNVFDDGEVNTGVATLSCYQLLVFDLVE